MSDNGAYFLHLWEKSIYFEILNGDRFEEGFALSLPPQSIEISEPQRVAETKTYGGLFIDDYGADSAKITISGTTGNSQVRQTYAVRGTRWLDGKNELYLFRDRMIRYKQRFDNFERIEMRMYDLSALDRDINGPVVPTDQRQNMIDADGWVVNLKDFRISRTKDQPYFYRYTIELTGIRPIGSFSPRYAWPIVRTPEQMRDRLARIRGALDWLQNAYNGVKSVQAAINRVATAIQRFESRLNRFVSAVTGIIPGLIDSVTNVVESAFSAYDAVAGLVTFPYDAANAILDSCINLRMTIEDFAESHDNEWGMPDSVLAKRDGAKDAYSEKTDILFQTQSSIRDAIQAASENIADAKAQTFPETHVLPQPDGSLSIVSTYGSFDISATSETRLDDLALQYLGDPDMAVMIASYNGISGQDDIDPGMTIRIPVLTEFSRHLANRIYTDPSNRTSLGSDVRLNASGGIVISEVGEVSLVTGRKNIEQAVRMRMAESIGRRVRLAVYGIRNEVGSTDNAALSYLTASIKDTTLQDPRVTDVFNMTLQGYGDSVQVEFDFTTISGVTAHFEGAF